MSEQELNKYRFSPDNEPTDEMLSQIMREVAEEARTSNKAQATKLPLTLTSHKCAET